MSKSAKLDKLYTELEEIEENIEMLNDLKADLEEQIGELELEEKEEIKE